MKTILIVEDETMLRECLRDIIENKGHKVVEAANGAEALLYLANNKVDMILSDIDMPKKNGIDFLKELRSSENLTPFIFMSGGCRYSEQELIKMGAEQLLQKPIFKFDRLLNLLAAA